MDIFCYLCFVSFMLVATCWERAGLLYVMFSCVIVTSHVLSWVTFGTYLYRFLFFCLLNYIYHELPFFKIVYFSECYPQSIDIQISIPAISSTTTLVSELILIRVWLPVKEACIMWTNI